MPLRALDRKDQWEGVVNLCVGFFLTLVAIGGCTFGPYNPAAQSFSGILPFVASLCMGYVALPAFSSKNKLAYIPAICALLAFVASMCMFNVCGSDHPYGVVGNVGLWCLVGATVLALPGIVLWLRYLLEVHEPPRPSSIIR